MKLETRVFIRISVLCLSFFMFGIFVYRFFSENDYWMITAIILVLYPFTFIVMGIDDDMREFYKKYPKNVKLVEK